MGCSQSNIDDFEWQDRKGRILPKKINQESDLKIQITSLIQGKTESIAKHYKIIKKVGSGTFGSVYKVKHLQTGYYRAMKVIKRDIVNYQDDNKVFLKEIEILSLLDHPNIVKIYEYYTDEINYYIMSELAKGGELYEQIYLMKHYSEAYTAVIMEQLFSAVTYMHSKGIVHRDLKPENILLEAKDPKQPFIKIIDFGTANFINDNENLKLKIGTPYYIAPEVLNRDYNKLCDVWSLGVIMFMLLCGYPPFDGNSDLEIMDKVLKGSYSVETKEWGNVSKEAKELINKLLTYNYKHRISADLAKKDPWIIKHRNMVLDNEDALLNKDIFKVHFDNLRKFSAKQKLQQSTIAFLVRQISNTNLTKDLRNIFRKLDKDNDGTLSFDEIKEGFLKYYGERIGEKEWQDIIQKLDQDGSNEIEYEEFIRCTINLEDILTEKNLKMAFNAYDTDGSGYLDIKEIKNALGLLENDNVSSELLKNILKSIDENGDGEISFEEFKDLMKKVLHSDNLN